MASIDPRKFSDQIYSWSPSDGAFWWPSDALYGRFTTQAPGGGGGGGGGPKPKLAINATDAVKDEGSDGGATAYTFTITRSGDTSGGTFVAWSVSGSGANPADAADFGGSYPEGVVFFGVGEATAEITVYVLADSSIELDESFTVTLSDATAGTQVTKASADGTILNDDLVMPGEATLSIAATSANKVEGSGGGTTAYTFMVTRSGDTTITSSVDWSVAGSGTYAADGSDFDGALGGTVNFAANETEQVITVYVNADGDVENNEGFTVTLSNPVDATIDVAAADGTIVNDDGILTEYTTAVAGSDYNITIIFVGTGWTTDMQAVVMDAADVVSGIIVGGVSDVTVGALADLGHEVAEPSPGSGGIRVDTLFTA